MEAAASAAGRSATRPAGRTWAPDFHPLGAWPVRGRAAVTGRAKVTLLLVEDYRLMFEGLSSILAEYPDFDVVGVATTVKDAVEKAVLLKPDLVLMDYRLPDGDGVQATERIRVNLPDP